MQNQRRAIRAIRPATPPTTPPAMAPVLEVEAARLEEVELPLGTPTMAVWVIVTTIPLEVELLVGIFLVG